MKKRSEGADVRSVTYCLHTSNLFFAATYEDLELFQLVKPLYTESLSDRVSYTDRLNHFLEGISVCASGGRRFSP